MKGYCDKHMCEYDYEITDGGKETDTCPQCRDEHFQFIRDNTKPYNPFADLAKQWTDRLAQKGEGQSHGQAKPRLSDDGLPYPRKENQ